MVNSTRGGTPTPEGRARSRCCGTRIAISEGAAIDRRSRSIASYESRISRVWAPSADIRGTYLGGGESQVRHRRCRYPRHLGSRRGYSRAGYPRSQYRMSVRCCGTPEALASMRLETQHLWPHMTTATQVGAWLCLESSGA